MPLFTINTKEKELTNVDPKNLWVLASDDFSENNFIGCSCNSLNNLIINHENDERTGFRIYSDINFIRDGLVLGNRVLFFTSEEDAENFKLSLNGFSTTSWIVYNYSELCEEYACQGYEFKPVRNLILCPILFAYNRLNKNHLSEDNRLGYVNVDWFYEIFGRQSIRDRLEEGVDEILDGNLTWGLDSSILDESILKESPLFTIQKSSDIINFNPEEVCVIRCRYDYWGFARPGHFSDTLTLNDDYINGINLYAGIALNESRSLGIGACLLYFPSEQEAQDYLQAENRQRFIIQDNHIVKLTEILRRGSINDWPTQLVKVPLYARWENPRDDARVRLGWADKRYFDTFSPEQKEALHNTVLDIESGIFL